MLTVGAIAMVAPFLWMFTTSLRSPRNAERLLSALARARAAEGEPERLDDLKASLGLSEE